MRKNWLLLTLVFAGCVVDLGDEDPATSTTEEALTASNRLASNRLASNRLASNRLASNTLSAAALTSGALIETVEGRDVYSYIVSCALPAGQSVTVKDSKKVSYTFPGEVGLAPQWATTTPTVSQRRWVTACVLARTNYYGVPIQISMRGANSALAVSTGEASTFVRAEGAFYGDLFDQTNQTWFACGTRVWTSALAAEAQRTCTISQNGVTTMCGFDYAYFCGAAYDGTHLKACSGTAPPWTNCKGGATTYPEVISIYLPN